MQRKNYKIRREYENTSTKNRGKTSCYNPTNR